MEDNRKWNKKVLELSDGTEFVCPKEVWDILIMKGYENGLLAGYLMAKKIMNTIEQGIKGLPSLIEKKCKDNPPSSFCIHIMSEAINEYKGEMIKDFQKSLPNLLEQEKEAQEWAEQVKKRNNTL